MKATVAVAAVGVTLIGAAQSPATTAKASPQSVDLEAVVYGPQLMPIGVNTTYRILVANRGPKTARGVQLLIWLPKGAYLLHAKGHCRRYDDLLTCRIGSLGLARFKWVRLEFIARDVGLGALRVHVVAKGLEPKIADNFDVFPIAYHPEPASADIGVSISPAAPPDWFHPADPIPGAKAFTVSITNHGPGESVRVLVHYAIEGLSPIAWSAPPAVGVSPLLMRSSTCNWATLAGETEPPSGPYDSALNYCIFTVSAGETQTYDFYAQGTPGSVWSVQADPVTPDPDSSNNFVSATF
jgi:hypothetical protein